MDENSFPINFGGTDFRGHYVKSASTAKTILKTLCTKNILFGVDTETAALHEYKHIPKAGLSPHLSNIRLLQVFDGKNSICFDMHAIGFPEIFIPFLESKRFIAHNAIFDLQFFKVMGIKNINLGCSYILYKILSHAVYPTDEGLGGSLANLTEEILKETILKKMQVSDWSEPNLTFEQIHYAALDAICTLKIAERLSPGLTKFGLEKTYQLCKDVQHPIADMQLNGILLDVEAHRKIIPIWKDDLYKAKKKVLALTGLEDVTPDLLASWLSKNLPKDVLKMWPLTDTGKLSTNADTLSDFSNLDIVAPFSEYQEKKKLTSTYGNMLIHQVNPKTGRIHAGYKICGARTGRLSSAHPNLQNLPRNADIRKNFRAPGQNIFLCADYSQIELRVAAELSQDKTMLDAYRNGIDLHALTASKVSGKRVEDVTDSERFAAKAFNFGLLFGLGKQKFSHYARKSYKVEVTQDEASDAIDTFRETYSGYREWQLNQVDKCAMTHSVRTPLGKLRKLNKDNCFGSGINSPVQGGAAEVMLRALVRLKDTKVVNCVHDEILVEAKDDSEEELEYIEDKMSDAMTKAYLDIFPNGITKDLIEVKRGHSWGEAK